MQTTAAKFANELRKLIEEEEKKIVSYITTGYVDDYASYQKYVGTVRALAAVLEMFEIAQANAEKI